MKELNAVERIAKSNADNFEIISQVRTKDILAIAEAFRALEQRLSMEEKAKKCVHLMLVSAAQDLGLTPEEAGHPFINNAIFNLIQRAEAAEEKLAEYEKQEPVAYVHPAYLQPGALGFDASVVRLAPAQIPLFTRPAPAVSLAELVPTVCDGKEQEAFEEYARSKGLDLSQHPLHYLFLDGKTNQARSAWRECLVYVRAVILRKIEQQNER